MDDPYKALGLTRSATQEEIRKAYRRIAKTDHPDLNPDPAAAERFKVASQAYELLKDPERRARFDSGASDHYGQAYYQDFAARSGDSYRQYAGGGGFGDFSDVFEDLFEGGAYGAGGPGGFRRSGAGPSPGFDMRGQDSRYDLDVGFLTAARGGVSQIRLLDGSSVEVRIPEGAEDGQTIRLRGKGGEGYGNGSRGDAYLTLHVSAHPDWSRKGNDVTITLPISIDEAVLGGRVQVQTLTGTVAMNLPRGGTSGQKMRLKGKGIKGGDQYVQLKVVMPPRIDDKLAKFMEEWRADHAYDPRGGGASG
ncbi:MAG: DnaJ C-terminal domain-containing protein [Paracoccus sp. (in: a-proteobacteria)]